MQREARVNHALSAVRNILCKSEKGFIPEGLSMLKRLKEVFRPVSLFSLSRRSDLSVLRSFS